MPKTPENSINLTQEERELFAKFQHATFNDFIAILPSIVTNLDLLKETNIPSHKDWNKLKMHLARYAEYNPVINPYNKNISLDITKLKLIDSKLTIADVKKLATNSHFVGFFIFCEQNKHKKPPLNYIEEYIKNPPKILLPTTSALPNKIIKPK